MTADHLAAAFDRIDAFVAVQGHGPSADAVARLQEAAGIDERARAVIAARVEALASTGQRAAGDSVLLGILLGLFAAHGG